MRFSNNCLSKIILPEKRNVQGEMRGEGHFIFNGTAHRSGILLTDVIKV
jgi:hypothetical protein